MIVPQLVTESGQNGMAELLHDLTADRGAQENLRRAAQLIIAGSRRDTAEVDRLLFERQTITRLLLGVMDAYTLMMPTIRTRAGRRVIAAIMAADLDEGN